MTFFRPNFGIPFLPKFRDMMFFCPNYGVALPPSALSRPNFERWHFHAQILSYSSRHSRFPAKTWRQNIFAPNLWHIRLLPRPLSCQNFETQHPNFGVSLSSWQFSDTNVLLIARPFCISPIIGTLCMGHASHRNKAK